MNNQLDTQSRDKLFRPSPWSKRYSTPEQVQSEHITFAKNESERIRNTIPYETIRYGETFGNETFDIYGIDLPKDAPIFIYIHGGYWQELDKSVSAYTVQPLVDAGHKVIVLDYDLCPNISLEQLVDQIQRAGIFIVSYATSMGTKGLQLAGHSAGAHLATCLYDKLVQSALTTIVKSLYLIAGVYDLSEIRYMPTPNPNNILSLNDANVMKLSPITFNFNEWVKVQTNTSITAIYLFIGTNEAPKLIEQTKQMDKLLSMHQWPKLQLIEMNGYDHFNIVEDLSKPEFQIVQIIIDEAKQF